MRAAEKKPKIPARGHRPHPNLRALDAVAWTYPGWFKDKKEAEEVHFLPDLFPEALQCMHRRQRVHDGHRSHPQLVALDKARPKNRPWTYAGWQKDHKEAMECHCKWPVLFDASLETMHKKQPVHDGDRKHPDLVALDAIVCNYPGWQKDFPHAQNYHSDYPDLFPMKLDEMRKRQKFHQGDRSDPTFVALDALRTRCNYPGWQKDYAEAVNEYFEGLPSGTASLLEALRQKQKAHEGIDHTPILWRWMRSVRPVPIRAGWWIGGKQRKRTFGGSLCFQPRSAPCEQNKRYTKAIDLIQD
jgi:hypothetical protein